MTLITPDFFLALLVLAETSETSAMDLYLPPALLGVMAVAGLAIGYSRFKRKRLIENVPTSKCAGVMIGLNELKGTGFATRPATSYLTQKRCIYYSYEIQEQYEKKTKDKDGKTKTKRKWKTIDSGSEHRDFYLRDDTGSIRVRPEGADFEAETVLNKQCRKMDPMYYGKGPRRSIANSTGRRRFTEEVIADRDSVYVIGDARIREHIVEPEIAEDEMGQLFLISSKSEDELTSKYHWQSLLGFGVSIAAAVGAVGIYGHLAGDAGIENFAVTNSPVVMIAAGFAVVTMIALMYAKSLYDGLVDLRHREQRAWSMLDVEFKRRADLIPNLVNIVQTVADHERQTLEKVAQARSGSFNSNFDDAQPDQAAQAIDQQSQALGQVFAVAEKYPQLKSEGAFRKLIEELTRCEEKIALARQFYNDSVERLNNRVETVPDMFMAPAANAEKENFLEIQGFEKKPIEIDVTSDDSEPSDQQGDVAEENHQPEPA